MIKQTDNVYIEKQKKSFISTEDKKYALSDIMVLNIDNQIKLCERRNIDANDIDKLEKFDILHYDSIDSIPQNIKSKISFSVSDRDKQEDFGYFLSPSYITYAYDDNEPITKKSYTISDSFDAFYDIETGNFVAPGKDPFNTLDAAIPSWVIPKYEMIFNSDNSFDVDEVKTFSKSWFNKK